MTLSFFLSLFIDLELRYSFGPSSIRKWRKVRKRSRKKCSSDKSSAVIQLDKGRFLHHVHLLSGEHPLPLSSHPSSIHTITLMEVFLFLPLIHSLEFQVIGEKRKCVPVKLNDIDVSPRIRLVEIARTR
ncbi:hypothetical protein CDAR_1321 [Caerostris darwini]|uniref:Uncharacterized protein n=1 Tax=Caerostris darwini TaxID=1538125 RepID=A0AAV4MVP3_9ARAC|nr:hypothetical protein CDAR_1321 [Caerostris darwini]